MKARYRVKVSGWVIVEAASRRHAEVKVEAALGQTVDALPGHESAEFFTEAREATPAR